MKSNFIINIINRLTVIISVVIFLVSLTQYTYCTQADAKGECTEAISLLLIGWIGIFVGEVASVTWLANLFLLASWIFIFTAPKLTLISSFFTLLLMLAFLIFKKVLINEAGGSSIIVSYGNGYWLWVTSSAVLVIGNSLAAMLNRKYKTGVNSGVADI